MEEENRNEKEQLLDAFINRRMRLSDTINSMMNFKMEKVDCEVAAESNGIHARRYDMYGC